MDLAFILNEMRSPQKILNKECHDWTLCFNRIALAAALKRNQGGRGRKQGAVVRDDESWTRTITGD